MPDFKSHIAQLKAEVEMALEIYAPSGSDSTIHKAMAYSLKARGKRLRPILCLLATEIFGGSRQAAMPAACALEYIHTYSLIHDDLPCMDNDDFRRGNLTNHKVFGEGIAVLAGDGLLTDAFGLLAQLPATQSYGVKDYLEVVAVAAGSGKLIAGQVIDLEAENCRVNLDQLVSIHQAKTGALIVASLHLGGMLGNANQKQIACLKDFGQHLGLAFQVIDDILDATESSKQLGKTAGKDMQLGKSTYVGLLGLEKAKDRADEATQKALEVLDFFGEEAAYLRDITTWLLLRKF